MRRVLILILIFIFQTVFIYGQEGKLVHVNKVNVSGNVLADATTIRVNSGIVEGASVGMEDIQQAIKNLWALRLFSDVEVLLQEQTLDGADILIKVKEYPRLNKVFVSGADELDTDDINDIISFYKGMVISPSVLYHARHKILAAYKKDGFLLAEVSIDTSFDRSTRVDVNLNIYEGLEVQIEEIRFHGNIAYEGDDLLDTFEETDENSWFGSADYDEKLYREDLNLLAKFYRDNGYRDAEVIRDSISYSEDGSAMFIDIWVFEGNQYYFGDISFKGNVKFSSAYLNEALNIKKGDPYNQSDFEEAFRQNMQNLYYNDGYLFARIIPVETPVGDDTLNVEFEITEGNVVTIREILIKGNSKTEDKVVRREMKLYPGDKFNNSLLERSARDIWVLNYFGNVVPDIKLIDGNDAEIDLEITVEEKSTDTANMSAGYSQRDGLIGSIGLSLNNFSLKHPLSGGGGQKLVFDWQFGRIYRSISLTFIEPWLFNTPSKAGFSVFNSFSGSLQFYGYEQQRVGFNLFFGRRFKWPDNFMRGDWSLLYSDIDLKYADASFSQNQFTSLYRGSSTDPTSFKSIGLRQILSRDTRNRPEFPTNGSVATWSIEFRYGPNEQTIQYEKFMKNELLLEWYTPTFLGTVLYTRAKLGLINELGKNSFVSQPEHFYLGGNGMGIADALRGYDDGDVGPKTAFGTPTGGKSMFSATMEWRFQISPNPTIYGLFFVEAGNIWRSPDQFVPNSLARSAGVGIRLFMPLVGIIGVDFGYGFDNIDPLGEKYGDWKIHFQFGRF